MTDRIDQPRAGYYAVRKNGRDVAAAILSDGAAGMFAMIDGKECSVDDVWISHRRDIDRAEYDRLIGQAAPLPAVTQENALAVGEKLLATVEKWKPVTITSEDGASKAKDLGKRLSDVAAMVEARRKAEKQPHLDAGRAVDAHYTPIVGKFKDAMDIMREKLTAWMKAEKKRIQAEAEAAAKATVEGANGEDKVLDAVQTPAPVQVRGSQPGRAASLKTHYRAVMIDYEAACMNSPIRNNPDVIAVMTKIANKHLKDGQFVVPVSGFKIESEEKASL